MGNIQAPPISGSGGAQIDIEKQKRYQRLVDNGYRTVRCPGCGQPYTAKNIVTVVACNKCGYREIKND